ncbi:glutamine amidotransferase [Stappia sp. 22II-S9-Z10]|nr:glutamine amidotransferase [Stappia sp. 22II-S9-Z10]
MLTIALVLVTIFIGSVMKGAIGIGLPLLATPVLSIHLGVPAAIAIVAVPIVVTNIQQVVKFRAELPKQRYLVPYLIAGMVGVGAGTFVLAHAPVDVLQIGLGAAVLAYLGSRVLLPPFEVSMEESRRLGAPFGFLAGLMQGAVGISSVVSIAFLTALKLERPGFVGSISAMFLVLSAIQILALLVEGTMTWERFGLGVLSLVATVVGMPIGDRLASRLSMDGFRRIIFVMLALLAALLVVSGIGALL